MDVTIEKKVVQEPAQVPSATAASAQPVRKGHDPNQAKKQQATQAPEDLDVLKVVVVNGIDALKEHLADWSDLVQNAIEPNIFYEPWMFLPALEIFGGKADLRFVFVTRKTRIDNKIVSQVCAFFPLEFRKKYKGVPISVARLWQHRHCFLCMPLLRKDCAGDALATFMHWFNNGSGAGLLELEDTSGDGPVAELLADWLDQSQAIWHMDLYARRPVLRPRQNGDAYLKETFSSKQLSSFRSKRRKLEAQGMTLETLDKPEQLDQWIKEFMDMETAGWKGKLGTALGSNAENRAYFPAIVKAAFERKQLQFWAMRINGGVPIAMVCNFKTASAGFYFKKTYDENYDSLSPGYILELERIQRMHTQPEMAWLDSCTATNTNDIVFSRWLDHRLIQTFVIAADREPAKFLISLMPLLRWVSRSARKFKRNRRANSPKEVPTTNGQGE